ncbi:MAG: hypothetical protein WA821_01685 [Anaerolineales bacterium]
MKKPTLLLFLILCALLLTACEMALATPPRTPGVNVVATCKLNLRVYVRQGPDVNDTVTGQVAFGSDTWANFDGDLVEESGSSHPISFYFDGKAIHFILDVDQGRIFGVGMMQSNRDDCSGEGGGTLSGPALGDMGDWRGQWVAGERPTPRPYVPQTSQPGAESSFSLSIELCIFLPLAVLVLGIAIWFSRVMTPFKKARLPKGKASNATLHKIDLDARPKDGAGVAPLAEYLATYTTDDKLFDLSFEIEKSSNYLGDCGLTVAKTTGTPSNQATALEIWLFDARSSQTLSKIVMSEFCYSQETLRAELEKKGQTMPIHLEEIVTLETSELIAKARIEQVEYDVIDPHPKNAFKTVVIKIRVWSKKDAPSA